MRKLIFVTAAQILEKAEQFQSFLFHSILQSFRLVTVANETRRAFPKYSPTRRRKVKINVCRIGTAKGGSNLLFSLQDIYKLTQKRVRVYLYFNKQCKQTQEFLILLLLLSRAASKYLKPV